MGPTNTGVKLPPGILGAILVRIGQIYSQLTQDLLVHDYLFTIFDNDSIYIEVNILLSSSIDQ